MAGYGKDVSLQRCAAEGPSMLSRVVAIAAGAVFLGYLAACSMHEPAHTPNAHVDSCPATCMVLKELRRRASAFRPPDSISARLTYDSSAVVPRLRYIWGEYYPENAPHVRFAALVASKDTSVVIRSPSDWVLVAGPLSVTSDDEAINACGEIVYTTTRRRTPNLRPRAYYGPESLTDLPLPVPSAQFLRDSLQIASAEFRSEAEWVVDFWAIEPTDVLRYRCNLGPNYASVVVRDSFPGYGYLIRH